MSPVDVAILLGWDLDNCVLDLQFSDAAFVNGQLSSDQPVSPRLTAGLWQTMLIQAALDGLDLAPARPSFGLCGAFGASEVHGVGFKAPIDPGASGGPSA